MMLKVKIKTKAEKDEWHNWFAWYPVIWIDDKEGNVYFVWLKTIQRKKWYQDIIHEWWYFRECRK